MDMLLTENDNNQSDPKPSIKEVDELAAEICTRFKNYKYFRWYCSATWKLGIERMKELLGRVEGAKFPGRLFTKYVNEEIKRVEAQRKLRNLNAEKEDFPTN